MTWDGRRAAGLAAILLIGLGAAAVGLSWTDGSPDPASNASPTDDVAADGIDPGEPASGPDAVPSGDSEAEGPAERSGQRPATADAGNGTGTAPGNSGPSNAGNVGAAADGSDGDGPETGFRPPKRNTSPEIGLRWIDPAADNVRLVDADGRTEVYPTVPRSRQEIAADVAERRARQRNRTAAMDLPDEWGFEDVTDESGIGFRNRPLRSVIEMPDIGIYVHYGAVAGADVTGNGHVDLYFLNQDGPNELWLNRGDGTFRNGTQRAGVAVRGDVSSSAAFGDIDDDGDLDLYVTTLTGRNRLFENRGGGRFRDVSEGSGTDDPRHSSSAALFDHDGDGDLDLYVVNLASFTSPFDGPSGFRIPSARMIGYWESWAEDSTLYENRGDGTFEAVPTNLSRRGEWDMSVTLVPDAGSSPGLYLSNPAGQDAMFHRTDGGFRDVTDGRLGITPHGSFGATVLDAAGNGKFDLYVTDKHSDMLAFPEPEDLTLGDRRRRATAAEMDAATAIVVKNRDQYFGSAYYRRTGDGYREAIDEVRAQTYLPWGPATGDLDGDGHVDVVVTSGMEYRWYVPDALLLNAGDGTFRRAEHVTGFDRDRRFHPWNEVDCDDPDRRRWCAREGAQDLSGDVTLMNRKSSRGSLVADIDGDGDLDVVTNQMNGRPRVLENNLAQVTDRRLLAVELEGVTAPPDGTGAVVTLRTTDGAQHRFAGRTSYLAQNRRPLHFGVPTGEEIRDVTVTWPTGDTDRYDVPRGTDHVTLRQGQGHR